jgi:hypothetical protein
MSGVLDSDRARFVENLGLRCTKSAWQGLSWFLMGNHVGVATGQERRSEEGKDRAGIEKGQASGFWICELMGWMSFREEATVI